LQFNCVWLTEDRTRRIQVSPTVGFRLISLQILVCLGLAFAHCVFAQQVNYASYPDPTKESTSLLDDRAALNLSEASQMDSFFRQETFAATSTESMLKYPDFDDATGAAIGQVREVSQEKQKNRPEQELIFEGLVSYGNYRIFASGYDEKLYTAGVEYDRHSWGHFLKAQVDYVAEFLPFILLDKPRSTDIWGNPVPYAQRAIREYVPGVGITPIGFRLQWRSGKAIKPYLEAKGGIIGFTKKVPSTEASYENFSLQSGTGVQLKLSERWGLRLGLFGDFHFSNGFVVPVDPGLDVMNANLGVSYHF